MEWNIFQKFSVGTSVVPEKMIDENRVEVLCGNFRMVRLDLGECQLFCLFHDVD